MPVTYQDRVIDNQAGSLRPPDPAHRSRSASSAAAAAPSFAQAPPDTWVDFRVDGRRFSTTKRTLMSQQNDLVALLDKPAGRRAPRLNSQGRYEVHLDRDGAAFRYLLSFLRNKKLPRSLPDAERALIYQEAKHFNVYGLQNELKNLYELREDARAHKTSNPLEHLSITLLLCAELVGLGKTSEACGKLTKLHHRWPPNTVSLITSHAVAHTEVLKAAYLFGFVVMQTQTPELRMPYFISLVQKRIRLFFCRGGEGYLLAKAGLVGASHHYLYKMGQMCPAESLDYQAQKMRAFDLSGGHHERIVTQAQKYLETTPGNAPMQSLLGTALIELNRFDEAQQALTRVLEIDGTNYTDYVALMGLGRCLVQQERHAEALQYLMRAYPYESFNAGLVRTIAFSLCKINAFADAEVWFRAAQALSPDQAVSYSDIGQTLALQNKFLEARQMYEQAIAIDPNDAFVRARMAEACEFIGDWAQAEIHRKRAVEIAPNDAVARCAMGRLLLEMGRPEDALAHYNGAAELDPNLLLAQEGQTRATEVLQQPPAQRTRRPKKACVDPKNLQLPTIPEVSS